MLNSQVEPELTARFTPPRRPLSGLSHVPDCAPYLSFDFAFFNCLNEAFSFWPIALAKWQ